MVKMKGLSASTPIKMVRIVDRESTKWMGKRNVWRRWTWRRRAKIGEGTTDALEVREKKEEIMFRGGESPNRGGGLRRAMTANLVHPLRYTATLPLGEGGAYSLFTGC